MGDIGQSHEIFAIWTRGKAKSQPQNYRHPERLFDVDASTTERLFGLAQNYWVEVENCNFTPKKHNLS